MPAERCAQGLPDFDGRNLVNGAALLASTANLVMQLAKPEVGYGVLESTVEHSQVTRHPLRRLRTTLTYLSVALLGTDEMRAAFRRQVNRSHASVRSTARSPVRYSAFDPRLQLWVAACLYRGLVDTLTVLHGPVDDPTADAIYHECRRLGTTLQVPPRMWPADRAAFERYWAHALAETRIDPPVRDYLGQLVTLNYLPWPVRTALGPANRFLTTGFLSPQFRAQMNLPWTGRDQRRFECLMRMAASASRAMPSPVSRFPFNACLLDLRVRMTWNRAREAMTRASTPLGGLR